MPGHQGYVRRHNPWVNWQQVGSGPHPANTLPPTTNLPFSLFPTDYATCRRCPSSPNLLNDMHDGSIAQGDAWLAANLNGYPVGQDAHCLLVTFDEDEAPPPIKSNTVVRSRVRPGVTTNQFISQLHLLRH